MKKWYWHVVRIRKATFVEVFGFVSLAVGFGLVYLPAGIIVTGVSAVLLAQGLEE